MFMELLLLFPALAIAYIFYLTGEMKAERASNVKLLNHFGVDEKDAAVIVRYYSKFVWGKKLKAAVYATGMISIRDTVEVSDYIQLLDLIPSIPAYKPRPFDNYYDSEQFIFDLLKHIEARESNK